MSEVTPASRADPAVSHVLGSAADESAGAAGATPGAEPGATAGATPGQEDVVEADYEIVDDTKK